MHWVHCLPPLSLLVQWIFFFLFLSLELLFPLKTLIWKNSISSYSDNVHHQVLLHIHVFGVRMSNFQEFVPEIFQDMWKSPRYVLMFMGIGELRFSWLIRNSKDHLILQQGFCFEKSITSSFFGNVELFWLLILKIIKDIFGFCIMHFEMTLNFAFYNIRTVYIYLSVLIFLIQVLYLYYFVDMCISKIPV